MVEKTENFYFEEMAGRAREIVKQQREQIADLYFNKKLKLWQIAQKLDIESNTVWRNLEKYREQVKDRLKVDCIAEEYLMECISTKNKLIQLTWLEYERTEDERVKVKLLGLINTLENSKLDVFEKLGILGAPIRNLNQINQKYGKSP